MADGGLTVEIDDDLAEQVKADCAARGIPLEMFVRDALAGHLDLDMEWSDDPDPAIDVEIAQHAMRTGDVIPAEDAIAWMRSWFTADELPMPLPPSKR